MPIVVTTFNQISQSAGYKEDDVSVNLTVCGGSNGGGGSEVLVVETLVFDEGQITCPTNGLNPQWGGGLCHSLSGNAGRTVVIIRTEDTWKTKSSSLASGGVKQHKP